MKITYILFIIIIILFYKIFNNCKIKENFANYNDIDDVIVSNYKIDFLSIRELSNIAQKLLNNGLTIPGNVNIFNNINSIPPGIIIAYNLSTAPLGWVLCNGQNGTPDLRGRFIRMSNDNVSGFDNENKLKVYNTDTNFEYNFDGSNDLKQDGSRDYKSIILKHKFKQYGGTDIRNFSNMDELPLHSHAMTLGGGHKHELSVNNWDASFEGQDDNEHMYTVDGGDPTQFKNISTNKHSHVVNSTGDSEAFNNMPPYYVLTYIMKT